MSNNHQNRSFNKHQQESYNQKPANPPVLEHEEAKKSFKDFDKNKLITEVADKIANIFKEEKDKGNKTINQNTQIRKFYDELYNIKMKSEAANDKEKQFESLKPLVYMLASKAAYAKGRDKVGKNFYNFIKSNVLSIETLEDLNTFLLYFEAVLGYYRFYNPKENN